MGDYIRHPAVKAFADISEAVYDTFHTIMGGHEKQDNSDRQYLVTRLLYISEITSTAIRLNATWALMHAGMSLTRDRYEQVVRFSWLARQKDDTEIQKFFAYYHARANKIFRSLKEAAGSEQFAKMVDDPPDYSTRTLTREERQYLEAWATLDLFSMARRRDALPALGTGSMATQPLALYYTPVYQQFSSVSHSDMYSAALLGLHKSPSGELVLAADPHWSATLCSFNALFDIIQCFECAAGFYGQDSEAAFEEHFRDWYAAAGKAFAA
jgi:hypothetical protein